MKKLIAKILSLAMVLQMASPMAVVQATEREEAQEESITSISKSVEDMASLSLAEQFALSQVMPISGSPVELGTEATPFLLSNVSQLQELADYVNDGDENFNAAHYKLTQDVSLSSVASWTAIGTHSSYPFKGSFDGDGHVISNMTIDNSFAPYQGFFGYTHGATIQNLGMEHCNVTGASMVGSLVGYSIEGTISNCYATGEVTGVTNIGGLVGYTSSDITNCYATGAVSGTGNYVGGLVGYTFSDITNCYATGAVAAVYRWSGGLVGGMSSGTISNCYATGAATSTFGNTGGLVGEGTSSTIENSVALNPSVNGSSNVNRVVGSGSPTLANNYAWSGMTVKSSTVISADPTSVNGADLTYSTFTDTISTQFEAIFQSNAAWSYTTNGLPTLKVVGGNQSSELPSYMKVGDTIKYIFTVDELSTLASEVNSGEDKSGITYLLMNDLDLKDSGNWTAIGSYTSETINSPFSGTFEGNGYVISNLKITGSSDYQGLFGYIDKAIIYNLGLENCSVSGGSHVGALVGSASLSIIDGCYVTGDVKGTGNYVGGLVGDARDDVQIAFSYATSTVSGADNVGGLVGDVATATIQNSYATGAVSGANNVGGLVGYATTSQSIKNSIALNPSVTGSGSNVNRVVGQNLSGTLSNNYAWSGMTVTDSSGTSTVTGGTTSNVNGADLSYSSSAGLSQQFSATFGNESAWTYTQNGLPILANVGGNQSSTLPSYITVGKPSTDIYTVGDLQALATWVNDGNDCSTETYTLMNDLDLSGVEWEAIGNYTTVQIKNPFSGTFDGDGYVIKNLTITGTTDYQGLFGYTSQATIQKLGIENCDVSGGQFVGALVGYASYSTIQYCYATGSVSSASTHAGGLVGYAYGKTIQYCYATGAVSGTDLVGGLVASALEMTIQNCYATGVVSGTGNYVGGLVGNTYDLTIKDSLALNPTVDSTGDFINRVVARPATLTNNYAWKDMLVNGEKVTGGTTTSVNGENLSVKDGIFVDSTGKSIYENTAIFDDSIWTIPKASNGDYMLLPTLTGVGNDVPSIYLIQTLDYEAEIGSNKYKTLEEAVSVAQDNDTINLLANVELESALDISKAITLDLKGFDIKQTDSNERVISVGSSNNLTLTDSGSGGSISGGSATQGGGVNVTGTLNLSGGTITGNTASTNGGGVYFDGTAFNLSGLVKITGNTVDSVENNVYLPSGKQITIKGNLDTNTRIGITTAVTPTDTDPVVFTSGASSHTTSLNNFTSDNPDYEVEKTSSGEYALTVGFTLPTFSGGDGSTSAPYIITTQKELEALATVVNSNFQNVSGKNYKELSYELGNDIDIKSNTNWTPIGTSYTFEGTFDGAGFEVKNLTIEATTNGNYGLFGNNTGTIKNLSVSGTISVTSSSWNTFVGGIVGKNYTNGVIDGCHSSVGITLTGGGTYLLAGGITGENSYGTILNSSNSGAVSSTGSASQHEAGGIAGSSEGGTVENCYNEGVISASKNAGGIIGRNGQDNAATLKNSYSSSSSVTGGTNVGAVVGLNGSKGTTENCYWLASGTPTKAIGSGTGTVTAESFDETGALTSGVTIDSTSCITLLSALNAWVYSQSGNSYFSWANEIYPIFGLLITLDENDFSFSAPTPLEYNGNGKEATFTTTASPTPTITVYYEGTGSTSYGSSTTPPTEAGDYKVTINVEEDANYVEVTGLSDASWKFTITKTTLDSDNFTFTEPSPLSYDGSQKTATVVGTADGDMTAPTGTVTVYYESTDGTTYKKSTIPPTEIGDYKVTIDVTGDANYEAVTGITDSAWEFEITAKNVSSLTVTAIPDQFHTGSALEPSISITGLVVGTDFTVLYTDNTDVGTATVVITGIGNYTGTLSTTFKIELSAYASLAKEFEDKLDQLDTSPTTYDDIRDVEDWYEKLSQDEKNGIDAYDSTLKDRLDAYTDTLPKEITVDTAVGKDNIYIVENPFDPDDFVVTLTTEDGKEYVLSTGEWEYSLPIVAEDGSGNLTAGTHTLTITYDKLTITTTIVVLDIFDISGTVVDQGGDPLENVQVELYQKGDKVATETTNSEGKFSFSDEPEGVYNLVATQDVEGADEVVKTILVNLTGDTEETVVMPDVGRNSLVDLTAVTDVLAVGGVDTVAGDFDLKADETVEVTLAIAEVQESDKADIGKETEENEIVGLWLDISLTSVITANNVAQEEESLIEISNLLEIVIELPLDLQNKEGYAIYREHDGDIHKIYTTENEDGEYIDVDGNYLTLHTKKFSTYALVVSDSVITAPNTDGGNTSPSTPEGNTENDSDDTVGNSSNSSSSGGSYYSSTKYSNTLVEATNGEVSLSTNNASSGTKVTITVSPEEGFEVDNVTVLRDSTGAEITVTDNGDGTYTFTQPSGKVTIEVLFKEVIMEDVTVFTDVSGDDWFRNVVYYAYDLGLMVGTSDTTFSPNADVTRGMFVQTLYNLSGEDYTGSKAPFSDLSGTEYYAEAVAWACENDVVAGYDDGTFRGEKFITREELMQILFRYVGEEEVKATLSYQDSTEIALWARDAVTWGTEKALVCGKQGHFFDPQGNATRGELAQILVNFVKFSS